MMRQYEGLKSLACVKSSLKKAIYSSGVEGGDKSLSGNIIDELPSEPSARPSSVCAHVWNHLKQSTNPYQLASIEKIMSGKAKENIALMQGAFYFSALKSNHQREVSFYCLIVLRPTWYWQDKYDRRLGKRSTKW
jgi:hypothetical protein